MNIFGFTITRTSKKKEEEKELEIFEKCVNTIDLVIQNGKHIIQIEPDIHTVQSISEIQEHLETLIDIYMRNKFSRPSGAFNLISLINDMRKIYVEYSTYAAERAKALNDLHNLNNSEEGSLDENSFGAIFSGHYKKALEQTFRNLEHNVRSAAKSYFLSLNAIRFTITYDITRIAVGTDIIKQYKETKGYKIPQKGSYFTIRFKKLSRDEINEQIKPKEDEEDEHARTNDV